MSANLPPLNIPVMVRTKDAESAMDRLARKARHTAKAVNSAGSGGGGMNQTLKAGGAAVMGMGGFGALGGVAGSMGSGGAMLAGAAAPFMVASQIISVVEAATKGANAALTSMRETGKQTFTANVVMLEKLAMLETQTQKPKATFGQSLLAGASTGGNAGGVVAWAQDFMEGLNIAASKIGSYSAGKSLAMSDLEAELVTTDNDAVAKRIQAQMMEQSRIDSSLGLNDMTGAQKRDASIGDWMVKNSSIAQWFLKSSI